MPTTNTDTDRLTFIEHTKRYPYPDGSRWKFILGEGKNCKIFEGPSVRSVIDLAIRYKEAEDV